MIWLWLACAGKDGDSGSAGTDDSATTGEGRRFKGSIVDAVTLSGIAGADVCLYPENVCAQSGPEGTYTLVSAREDDLEFLLLVTEPGFLTLTVPFTVPAGEDGPEDTFAMWAEADFDAIGDDIGLDIDTVKGAHILVTLRDAMGEGRIGLSVSIDPKGAGPFYATTPGDFSETETSTTSAGQVLFANLAEGGSTKIYVDGACVGVHAWEGIDEGSFRATLDPGRLFSTQLRCD